jgi:SAM-dependent methyltransferase
VVTDLEEGLPFLPDSSVDELRAKHVLEHVENFEFLMREIVRVLKSGGTCRVRVPHFTNPYGYSDYTHKRLFGLYTFYYFVAPENQLSRKVPNYCPNARIRILSVRLIFGRSKRLLRFLTRAFGWVINRSSRLQEWYEAKPWRFPCDEIEVVFTPDK